MNSDGGFHEEVEENGTISLVYHHPIFQPIPQTQNPSSIEATIDDDLQPLFLCPSSRLKKSKKNLTIFPITCSPKYIGSTTIIDEHESQDQSMGCTDHDEDHPTLPLFWCNDKEFDTRQGGCVACRGSHYSTNYFFCDKCNLTFHKECVQSPSIIKHPYHPDHSLHLFFLENFYFPEKCLYCGRETWNGLVYYCSRCKVFMHTVCAMKSIPFVVDKPKSHDHSLTLFAKPSLTCNVCGLIRIHFYPTYICLKCSFAAHKYCMYAPHIIRISRHHHRIHYTSSLPPKELFCGVCRTSIDGVFGAYTCDKCSDYAVHTRCALRGDICDGVELEGIPEEADISLDPKPFEMVSEGVIHHFLHDHHRLKLEVNILYDEKKICEACVMPIDEGNFYSCTDCEFILHDTCAKSPRRIQHALHPHPLTLKARCRYPPNLFSCDACRRDGNGLVKAGQIIEVEEKEFTILRKKSLSRPICNVCKYPCQGRIYSGDSSIACSITCFKELTD